MATFRPPDHRKGLTLFELAVVCAIAAILVALGVLSIRSVVSRTKVSRVLEDQRAIARAIQNYTLDHGALPSASQGLHTLTKPTAYLGSVPVDPFQPKNAGYLYLVPPSGEIAALVISPGPDGDFDLPGELYRFADDRQVRAARPLAASLPDVRLDLPEPSNTNSPGRISETDAAILSTYLRLGRYDAAKGDDGDIITIIRY